VTESAGAGGTNGHEAWLAAMASRFERSARAPRPVPAPPAEWRARAESLAAAPGVARLVVGAADTRDVARRLAAGVAEAFAQAGDEGARVVVEGLAGLGALLGGGRLLHGTGSWGLAGILRDGAVRAGGDGLSGEVAVTDVDDPAIYVCRTVSLFNYYSAACFGYMNANRSGEDLRVSSVRAGLPWLADFFTEQFFGEGASTVEERSPAPRARVVRHRTIESDERLRRAYDRAASMAASREFPARPGPLARVVGHESEEAAFSNAIFAISQRARALDPAFAPGGQALCAAVERHAPALRARLLCPLAEDDDATRARKARTLAALGDQFPCVLVIDPAGLDVRQPSYFWTGEGLVEGAIDATRMVAVHVPERCRGAVAGQLQGAGLAGVQVHPLEHFEALRLVAEVVPGA
jgi:hypothetical protein